jgi:hypothetical protein
VTITSELNGYLAHWPSCVEHIEAVAWRVRRAHQRAVDAAAMGARWQPRSIEP